MNPVAIPSELQGKGHTARFCVRLAAQGGWEVHVEVDDRVVAVRHCEQWHTVERFRACLETQLPSVAWIQSAEHRG